MSLLQIRAPENGQLHPKSVQSFCRGGGSAVQREIMMDLLLISEELADLDARINDALLCLRNGFQKLEKIKDPHRQRKQLEELINKIQDCKRSRSPSSSIRFGIKVGL